MKRIGKNKWFKRGLSALLCFIMILGMLTMSPFTKGSSSVFAASTSIEDVIPVTTESDSSMDLDMIEDATPSDATLSAVVLTVNSIQEAGIVDKNFAQAIYEAIASQPNAFTSGTLTKNTFASVEELLNNFTGDINASNKGIKNIEGVKLLRTTRKLNLQNNLIADLRPLATGSKSYYGQNSLNLWVYFEGNPIYALPSDFGGRLYFADGFLRGGIWLLPQEYVLVVDDNPKAVNIPINIKQDEDTMLLLEDATILVPNNDPNIGAKIADDVPLGGRIAQMPLDNIKGSGHLDLYVGMNGDSKMGGGMRYWNAKENFTTDRITAQIMSISFVIPIEIKMNSKVEKDEVNTQHSVTLKKYGQETDIKEGEEKNGATYTLYKKSAIGATANPKTDKRISKIGAYTIENGLLTIDGLEKADYYLIEETAPEGYQIDKTPLEFSFGDGSISLTNKSGNVIQISTDDNGNPVYADELDGVYVLGGDLDDAVNLTITPPSGGGELDSLTLSWSKGTQGGEAGTIKYAVGAGVSTDEIKYVESAEAVELAVEAKLKECQKLYQNVKISASFKQNIVVNQLDPLQSVDVTLEAKKKLVDANGNTVMMGTIPNDFTFTMQNDPDYPNEPKIGTEANGYTLTAKNTTDNGKKAVFDSISLGAEITADTAKDVNGNYVYHFIIKEATGTDTSYGYDTGTIKATVIVGKAPGKDLLEVKNITYTKVGGSTLVGSDSTNTFANTYTAPVQPEPAPTTITLTATKTLDGKAPTGSNYSFVLKDESGNIIQTVNNNGGTITFNRLTFSQTGTYIYTLSEVVGTDSNVNYDKANYTVTIKVTKIGDYKAEVIYQKNGAVYVGTPTFANTTKPTIAPETPKIPNKPYDNVPQTGDTSNTDTPATTKPTITSETPKTPNKPYDKGPQTGDTSNTALWLTLTILSFTGLIGLQIGKKKYSPRRSK